MKIDTDTNITESIVGKSSGKKILITIRHKIVPINTIIYINKVVDSMFY